MNFFSPGFRPIEKTNTHKINSVILKLNTNLKKPMSKYFEMKIEINKQIAIINRHLATVLSIKLRTGKWVIGRSIETLSISAPIAKNIIDNWANSGLPPLYRIIHATGKFSKLNRPTTIW